MKKAVCLIGALAALAVFGERVDVKVETLRADKSCKVETVSAEIKDGTAHFVWPRTRIPSDAVRVNVKPAFSSALSRKAPMTTRAAAACSTISWIATTSSAKVSCARPTRTAHGFT